VEATFIINESELKIDFLNALKELCKNKARLQITVSDLEDFGLLSKETPDQYLKRLENCMKEMENPEKN
jgi:hypothetical protein